MQLARNQFALAAAVVVGASYVVCGAFVALAPDFALKLLGWLAHLVNVEKFAGDVQVTAVGFALGFVQAIVYAYVFAWLIAELYNRFAKSGAGAA